MYVGKGRGNERQDEIRKSKEAETASYVRRWVTMTTEVNSYVNNMDARKREEKIR